MRSEFLLNVQRRASSPAQFLTALATCRFVVEGASMEPALSHGQRLLIRPLGQWDTIARGDIVVAHDPRLLDTDYIKRIIGLPGEHVRIGADGILINERSLDEPYLAEGGLPVDGLVSQWLLGEDEYLVLGDNRNDSRDSRKFGPLSREHILGRAWLRYWPLEAWGRASTESPLCVHK